MRDWYKNKVVLVLCHLLAWTFFFSLSGLLRPGFRHGFAHSGGPPFFAMENLLKEGFLVILFYLNAYYLIPEFLNRKKITIYIVFLLSVFSLSFLVFPFFSVLFVLSVSTAYRFVLDKLMMENLQQQQQHERLKTELSFLRSQISPHFIFNILNSAVSLARTGSDQLEPTLIKLSNLLRYMLYHADDETVPLTQEVDYLESYIDLQKIRFEEDVQVTFTHDGLFLGHGIEPMLLIPFVENAFKHGIGRIDKPAIFIDLKEEKGVLHFQVKNKFNASMNGMEDKNSGIGLANVKKRLELLYDDEYTLDMQIEGEWFTIGLNLVLR